MKGSSMRSVYMIIISPIDKSFDASPITLRIESLGRLSLIMGSVIVLPHIFRA